MWTHKIKIVKKNQCPKFISHGGASLLKFLGRNIMSTAFDQNKIRPFCILQISF